jgi:Type IX secretion system membrane protein PorP/SprF
MGRKFTVALGLITLVLASAQHANAQQEKLAQTGMKFLSFSVDPRAAGMGGAMTSVEGGAEQMFYNPAAMGWQESFMNVSLASTQWIADVNYNAGSIAFRPKAGRFGIFSISFLFVDFGDLQETIRANNEQGFIDLGTFKPAAYSVGFGYARAFSDRFSVGGQVKIASEDLGSSVLGVGEDGEYVRSDNTVDVFAFDFGVFYKTGFKSLNFALSARNFSREIEYEVESFQLPLTFKIGVSMDVLDFTDADKATHSLLVSLDAENPRDFSEQVKIGTEYTFMQTFSLRAGYVLPTDEQGISVGLGVKQLLKGAGFAADYSYTDFGVFAGVHRIALRFSL